MGYSGCSLIVIASRAVGDNFVYFLGGYSSWSVIVIIFWAVENNLVYLWAILAVLCL